MEKYLLVLSDEVKVIRIEQNTKLLEILINLLVILLYISPVQPKGDHEVRVWFFSRI